MGSCHWGALRTFAHAMGRTDTEQKQSIQILALQLAGLRYRHIAALFDKGARGDELPLGLPSGLECYTKELTAHEEQATSLLGACHRLGIHVLPFVSPSYPDAFHCLAFDRPLLLYAKGNLALTTASPRLAIIGTRHPDEEGTRRTYELARRHAEAGAALLSGLARGCDALAHQACLDAGGKGIAIVATGLDEVYPREHQALQEALLRQGGLILSEYPPFTPISKYQLIARDRLQAALAERVIVTECGAKSGTLHTVRFARKYQKPVEALRYETYTEASLGNHYLLTSHLAEEYSE